MISQVSNYSLTEDHSYNGPVSARRLKDLMNTLIRTINDLEDRLDRVERQIR